MIFSMSFCPAYELSGFQLVHKRDANHDVRHDNLVSPFTDFPPSQLPMIDTLDRFFYGYFYVFMMKRQFGSA